MRTDIRAQTATDSTPLWAIKRRLGNKEIVTS